MIQPLDRFFQTESVHKNGQQHEQNQGGGPEGPIGPEIESREDAEKSCMHAFADLAASLLWCSTCGEAVRFRTLTQLDAAEVYLCHVCDSEVGQKRTTASPSNNGSHARDDAPLATQTSSADEADYDQGVI